MEARPQAREELHWGAWIGPWQGTIDVWHKARCEKPHGRGEQAEESGVEGVPEVDQQEDVFLLRLDDPTNQFEMVMVLMDMCKPTVGTMVRLMRVMLHCTEKQTPWGASWTGTFLSQVACGCRLCQRSRHARVCQRTTQNSSC